MFLGQYSECTHQHGFEPPPCSDSCQTGRPSARATVCLQYLHYEYLRSYHAHCALQSSVPYAKCHPNHAGSLLPVLGTLTTLTYLSIASVGDWMHMADSGLPRSDS